MVNIPKPIEDLCDLQGIKLTAPRRVILAEIVHADDHPDIDMIHERIREKNYNIGIATIYRTIALLEGAKIITRNEFQEGRARYEMNDSAHHDHLINLDNGDVIEFNDPEIEELQEKIAHKLGFKLIHHRMILYGVKI